MPEQITIKQIAEMAGVSRGSVDRVLHKRGNVSPKIKVKIEQVLKQINYKPNISASLLARNNTYKILIIIPRADSDSYWDLPAQGIKEGAQLVNHYPIELEWLPFTTESVVSFKKAINKALTLNPDAILLAPIHKKESHIFIQELKKKSIPIITINTQLGDGSTVPYIGQDSLQSGIIAGRLFELLVPRIRNMLIVNMGSNSHNAQHIVNKESGLRLFFGNKEKVEIDTLEIDNYDDINQVKNLMSNKLEETQGIFVTNSRVYKLVNAIGDRIAEHNIKLIGYDLIKPNVDLLKDGVVSFLLNQNPKQQGLKAMNMLIQKLLFKQDLPTQSHLTIDVVMKENCDYFFQGD